MKFFRADLHIHTVLSPCGDLEMSPINIVERAQLLGLDIIGITDHNSTKHAPLIAELAKEKGIFTLCGAEVTSKEEVHLLCFMPDYESLNKLQHFIDTNIQQYPNNPALFGEQLIVNEQEEILEEESNLLISGINKNVNEISDFVFKQQGIIIPAHIDRPSYSLISQLGFVPQDLKCHAYEISKYISAQQIENLQASLPHATFIRSSDAHFINDLGAAFTRMYLEASTFEEIKMALMNKDGRKCDIL
ncbi:MAG: histidinol-phosphatase [Bacteroidetes bacterium 4572_77]|nr:MAG: histidinol-phosphatase [Bacteroidetes bacterium 4572_77]